MSLPPRTVFTSALCYRDAEAALVWLESAFGFEPAMIIRDGEGKIAHSEMRMGDGLVMIGNEWDEATRSPASLDGRTTQTVHVQLTDAIDAHCERARAAGAVILAEPETQFYGDRTYRARDPEGHIWTFGQTVEALAPEEWDARGGGLKTEIR
ncbi:MAG: VOC family protein [Alphaproteobacteria bacterium]|nr:VOC family protein [Alphaproteobacteria bacterium]